MNTDYVNGTFEGKTWKEWEMELSGKIAELEKMENANIDVELEIIYLKLEYNDKIRKAWENERMAKNANKSIFDMVGKKVFIVSGSKYWKRVLKWNGYQFYANIDNQKAVVKYNAIWDNFTVEHWEYK